MADIEWNPGVGESVSEAMVLKRPPVSKTWMVFVILAGVLLPLGVYVFELATRWCSMMFDPIPTYWHLGLLAVVPLTNLAVVLAYWRLAFNWVRPLTFLIGVSIGVTCVYSIQFLPISPFCVIAVLFFGIGLLGLSPFFALAASIVSSRRLRAMELTEAPARRKLLLWGIMAGVIPLALYLATGLITYHYLEDASSTDPQKSRHAVRMIRIFGSDRVLLRECYNLPSYLRTSFWDEPASGSGRAERAREVYYRVTGRTFNSVTPPSLVGPRSAWVENAGFDTDNDVGGTAVNSVVKNLEMTSSRMDARVDPLTLTAYSEWVMVFKNTSIDQQEARAEIVLPPGGVVSRLTLWIDGEEREAAFGARGTVRKAYQEVAVVQRHDPVLVTSCGPDRVLMQCFPVPPNGGEMKVRLGVTSPLVPQSESRAITTLPRMVERNFRTGEQLQHSLFATSTAPVSFGNRTPTSEVQRMVSNADIADGRALISCAIPESARAVWADDATDPAHFAVVQRLVTRKTPAPRDLVLVLDTSACVSDAREELEQALAQLPDTRLTIVRAEDMGADAARVDKPADAAEEASMMVQHVRFAGGIDNRPALVTALDEAASKGSGTVLWIHGPQPQMAGPYTEHILQRLERHPGAVNIISVSAVEGHNVVLDDLQRTGAVTELPRFGSLGDDLKRFFAQWKRGEAPTLERERVQRVSAAGYGKASHVTRLWVRDQVERICRMGDSRLLPDVAALAVRSRIVSALTGAVVLETREQYQQAGLDPADAKSVPTVTPEPATWAALTAGCAGMLLYRRRRSRN